MLKLSRKNGQSIWIGNVRVVIAGIGTGRAQIGIEAPDDVEIWREELAHIPESGKLIRFERLLPKSHRRAFRDTWIELARERRARLAAAPAKALRIHCQFYCEVAGEIPKWAWHAIKALTGAAIGWCAHRLTQGDPSS